MTDVTREEFEYRTKQHNTDINKLGDSMRERVKVLKADTERDFEYVWKAINGMIFKVAAVVTICSTLVLVIFKMWETVGIK